MEPVCRVFICYRRIDGQEVAQWLHEILHGCTLPTGSGQTVEVYLDLAAPAVSDWRKLHQPALESSHALVVVCTPGLYSDLGSNDWVHREMQWWFKHRAAAPILVDATGEGDRWIPPSIRGRWPNAQRVDVNLAVLKKTARDEQQEIGQRTVNRILGGIMASEVQIRSEDLDKQKSLVRQLRRSLGVALAALVSMVLALLLAGWFFAIANKRRSDSDRYLARELISQAERALLEGDILAARALAARAYKLDGSERIRNRFLAIHWWSVGRMNRAVEAYRHVMDAEYSQAIGADAEQLQADRAIGGTSARLALNTWAHLTRLAGENGYDEVLKLKGLSSRVEVNQRRWLKVHGDSALLSEIGTAEMTLAGYIYTPQISDTLRSSWWQQFDSLSARLAGVYKKANKQTGSAGMEGLPDYRWDEIQGALKAGEVLIDFLQYGDRYSAWILRSIGQPIRVELGGAERINEGASCLLNINSRSHNYSTRGEGTSYVPCEPEARNTLRTNFWEPLERVLAPRDSVIYIVPDGAVSTLPISAIPERDSTTVLLDSYTFIYLISAQDLVPSPSSDVPGRGTLLVGGVEGVARMSFNGSWFQPAALPGSEREVDEVAHLAGTHSAYQPVTLVTSRSATEDAVRRLSRGRRYLHFATHSWASFQSTEDMPSTVLSQARSFDSDAYLAGLDPMFRAGIALSRTANPMYDGILTAVEVSRLDLRGVHLVVLSGCETAGGNLGGESILGMTRAFKEAGAQNIVASFADVEDQATADLMTRFYLNLTSTEEGPATALRMASLELRRRRPQDREWAVFAVYQLGNMVQR